MSKIIDLGVFRHQTDAYVNSLVEFRKKFDLPNEWFEAADHVAVKAGDTADFESLINIFRPMASKIACIDLNNRRLASAKLIEPLRVGELGSVEWVEIMEPRPEKVGKDIVGFEHMEFHFPDFESARSILDEKKIPYEMQRNPNHEWVNIVINDTGQELKLTDMTHTEISAIEFKAGLARYI